MSLCAAARQVKNSPVPKVRLPSPSPPAPPPPCCSDSHETPLAERGGGSEEGGGSFAAPSLFEKTSLPRLKITMRRATACRGRARVGASPQRLPLSPIKDRRPPPLRDARLLREPPWPH